MNFHANMNFQQWLSLREDGDLNAFGVDLNADQDPMFRPQNFSKHKVKIKGDKIDKKYGKKKS